MARDTRLRALAKLGRRARSPASGSSGQMHGLVALDARAACPARDPLERPADRGRMRRDRGAIGLDRLIALTGIAR